jgi:hypothetical protein
MSLLVGAPALAQSTPPAGLPDVPPGLIEPTIQRPSAVAPTPTPPGQGRQPGQGEQVATTPPAAAPRPEPRAPSIGAMGNTPMPAATNIRLDLVITDTYTGVPVKKTVSLLVLTGHNGMIRTRGSDGWSVLNVDAIAAAYTGGQVSLRMTFEYTPAQSKEPNSGRAPTLNESITVVLQDGKPLMVSQSADPTTERRVTAELTATILK